MRRVLSWVVVLVLIVGSAGTYWRGAAQRAAREALPPEQTVSEAEAQRVSITVSPVERQSVQRTVEAVGTVHGYEEVVLRAKVEGRVRRIVHDVADRVRPGEALLEIDPIDYELTARQAEQALQVELAKLGLSEPPGEDFDLKKVPAVQQAAARLEQMKARYERTRSLAAQKASASEEVTERIAEMRVAEAEHENQLLLAKAALATMRMKRESLAIMQQQLRDTVIRAPTPTRAVPGSNGEMTYAISQRDVSEGSFVRVGADLFGLVIDQTLKLRVAVPERHSGDISAGQEVEVFVAAYAAPFKGQVSRINPSVATATRTFEVEIRVPNPRGQLKPGSFAKATIHTQSDQPATTVPRESLVTFAGVTKIFLVERGKAKDVPVSVGLQSQDWVEITQPELPIHAQVVTSGQSALSDGAAVTVRQGDLQSR